MKNFIHRFEFRADNLVHYMIIIYIYIREDKINLNISLYKLNVNAKKISHF